MKKPVLIAVGTLLLAVSACNTTATTTSTSQETSSSSTSSVTLDPTTVTLNTVVQALSAIDFDSIISFDYVYRSYQDNYITGDIFTNKSEHVTMHNYVDGAEGVLKTYEPTKPSEILVNEVDSGRIATYYVSDEDFVVGYVSDDSSVLDNNYLSYFENHRYTSPHKKVRYYEGVYSNLYKGFSDPNAMWDPSLGFVHEEDAFTVEVVDDTYVCTYSAYAPEMEYYSHEVGTAKVVLDADLNYLSGSFEVLLYDIGYSDDMDAHANNYSYAEFSNITYGTLQEKTIEPFADSSFLSGSISGKPHEVVEGLPEGNLSDDNVKDILRNVNAYGEGAKSATLTSHYGNYLDMTTWEYIGAVDVNTTLETYSNGILIANNNCDFESEEYVDYSETIQYVCGDAGVETTSKINDEYSYSIQQAAYITSLKQIMSPSPAYRESTILYNFNEIASLGFGISNDNGIYAIKHELVKATNNNGTIEIEISSTLESEWMQDSVRTYKFTIVDNFMTHYEYVELFVADVDENTSYTNEYTDSFVYDVVKGELDEYTGELFPFEMPETSY